MLADVKHRAETIPFVPADLLVLYSDGITEALDAEDREFGMERLGALVRGGATAKVEVLSREIFDAVSAYTRGVAQYDDQTVLVARAG
jgi:sigma-B regulation protein RsbU (phosphoserine phosphatase)